MQLYNAALHIFIPRQIKNEQVINHGVSRPRRTLFQFLCKNGVCVCGFFRLSGLNVSFLCAQNPHNG